jgi:hypothetical protein
MNIATINDEVMTCGIAKKLGHVLVHKFTVTEDMLLENPNTHPNSCIPTSPQNNSNFNKS